MVWRYIDVVVIAPSVICQEVTKRIGADSLGSSLPFVKLCFPPRHPHKLLYVMYKGRLSGRRDVDNEVGIDGRVLGQDIEIIEIPRIQVTEPRALSAMSETFPL